MLNARFLTGLLYILPALGFGLGTRLGLEPTALPGSSVLMVGCAWWALSRTANSPRPYLNACLQGLLFSTAISTFSFYWLQNTMVVYGGLGIGIAGLGFALYCIFGHLKLYLIFCLGTLLIRSLRVNSLMVMAMLLPLGDLIVPEIFPWQL